jgi:hypothetical protein
MTPTKNLVSRLQESGLIKETEITSEIIKDALEEEEQFLVDWVYWFVENKDKVSDGDYLTKFLNRK